MQTATAPNHKPTKPGLAKTGAAGHRFLSIDLCKGFTVLFMPFIHSMMLYSKPEVYTTIPAFIIGFVAQWPGAQIFMFLMGTGAAFSKRSTASQLKRAFLILLAAFLLNTLKFVLPLWLGLIPSSFIDAIPFEHQRPLWINFLLLGDIFQFAALALVVLALVKKVKRYVLPVALLLTLFVLTLSPLFWDMHAKDPVTAYLFTLLGGHPPDAYFPFFPWLIYPLTGLAVGEWMKDPAHSMKLPALAGLTALCITIGVHYRDFALLTDSFYRTDAILSLQHLGFILAWFSAWVAATHLFFQKIQDHPVIVLLRFCGRYITLFYVLQWTLIFWALPFFGYQQLSLYQTLLAGSMITIIALGITYLFTRRTPRQASHSNQAALNTK